MTHHGYNVLKMPGCSGIINIACDKKDTVCSLEHAYRATMATHSDGEDAARPAKASPMRKKQLLSQALPES
mgnify:CR=1 FL=1